MPEEYIPEISEKLQTVGLKWSDFQVTDNSCKPHPPPTNPLIAVRLAHPVACQANMAEQTKRVGLKQEEWGV